PEPPAASCAAFTASWATDTLNGGNDSTLTNGNCYRYREVAADNVGNSTNSSASNTAKIDTSAPSTPTLAFGGLSSNGYYDGAGTFWFRPSAGGTVTVTALSSDSESGIGSYTRSADHTSELQSPDHSVSRVHLDNTIKASTTAPTTSRPVNSTTDAA